MSEDSVSQNGITAMSTTNEDTPSGEPTELVVRTAQEAEVRVLADHLAGTYRGLVEDYRARNKIDAAQADAEVQRRLLAAVQKDGDEYGVQSLPPGQVDWFRLTALAEHNPSAMMQCWQAINQVALDELSSGHRAAMAVAQEGESPWQRAQFLALRASMIVEWQPRGGIELILIDTMAQAQVLYERWLRVLATAATAQAEHTRSIHAESPGKMPPRLADSQAVEQAAAMVDRFNRLFLRTLRQLRDLRRYTPAVVIQNADQVNIAEQQINLASDAE